MHVDTVENARRYSRARTHVPSVNGSFRIVNSASTTEPSDERTALMISPLPPSKLDERMGGGGGGGGGPPPSDAVALIVCFGVLLCYEGEFLW